MEGEGFAAVGQRIPGVLVPRGSCIAGLREAGARLQSAKGNDGAASEVEFLLSFTVGIDGHFGSIATDGIDQSALDVAVAIGVDTIVVGRASIDAATFDGHVAA